MGIKNSIYKMNNTSASAWDDFHFETNSGQVKHTPEEGDETTVEEALNGLNRNIQAGRTSTVSIAANSSTAVTVTFPHAYSAPPIIVVCARSEGGASLTFECSVNAYSATGFTARITNRGTVTYNAQVFWIAYPVTD